MGRAGHGGHLLGCPDQGTMPFHHPLGPPALLRAEGRYLGGLRPKPGAHTLPPGLWAWGKELGQESVTGFLLHLSKPTRCRLLGSQPSPLSPKVGTRAGPLPAPQSRDQGPVPPITSSPSAGTGPPLLMPRTDCRDTALAWALTCPCQCPGGARGCRAPSCPGFPPEPGLQVPPTPPTLAQGCCTMGPCRSRAELSPGDYTCAMAPSSHPCAHPSPCPSKLPPQG